MKSIATLCALLGGATAASPPSPFKDILEYEQFSVSASSRRLQAVHHAADERYATSMKLDIPHQDSVLTLDLTVNHDLFAPGWSMDTYDDDGALVNQETDASEYMCHYTGTVLGHNSSFVTFSVCDEVGMTGHIHVDDLDLEVLSFNEKGGNKSIHAASQNLGDHIIYDMRTLVLPEHEMGEQEMISLDGDSEDGAADASGDVQQEDAVSSTSVYQIDAVIVSNRSRMNAFSSASSEASNAQSIVNAMNTRFANASWGSGRAITSRIQRQRQNPSGWSSSHGGSISAYLCNLSTYKQNTDPNDDNMIGLTHTRFGSTIGYAWTNRNSSGANPMCHRYYAANVNNVGWS